MSKSFLYASLWNEHGGAPGIALLSFESETGEVKLISMENENLSFNRSFYDKNRNIMYFSNETDKCPDVQYPSGCVYGYSVCKASGKLTELFHRPTMCPNPSYISLDPTGKFMVVAHHSTMDKVTVIEKGENGYYPNIIMAEAVIELFEVNEDGTLGDLVDVKKHVAEKLRKHPYGHIDGCHPHSAVFSPDGKLIAVCDKGDGYVYIYTIDYENKCLKLLSKTFTDPSVSFSAPRYCAFHPTKPYLFINHERMTDNKLNVCSFLINEDGTLTPIDCKNALSPDVEIPEKVHFEQQGFCTSTDGNTLYTILNGPNAVGVLKVNEDGTLIPYQNVPIDGKWPRGIVLSPDGKYILTGSLQSGGVASYKINSDGSLTPTGYRAEVHGVSYLTFLN
jgi:6-phosphogluconolactonase (cycloisomerase 2 family)